MTKHLDPKFASVIRLMRGTTFGPERDNARDKAERIARRCGMTLEEALQVMDAAAAPPETDAERRVREAQSFWDDQAKRKAEWKAHWTTKTEAMLARRAATVARFGSEEAALAPCWRERLILDAVAPWRTVNAQHPRWTDRLDGWRGDGWDYAKAPARVVEAIASSYPLPATFAEAKIEHDYWEARSDEMEDLIRDSAEGLGNGGLDRAADLRACMIRDLMENDLHLTTLAEVHARFAMYRTAESHDDKIEAALFRDLSALVDRQAEAPVSPPAAPATPIYPFADTSIGDALAADPSRSDRAIAREVGCSPTTVGRMRGQMGLSGKVRSVRRGGQMYAMRARADGAAA